MRSAQYYTYRNLNFGDNFSVKHKGRVIDYISPGHVKNGIFRVSEAGRRRCLATNKRNVHAFVVSSTAPTCLDSIPNLSALREVKYNPYKAPMFYEAATGNPVYGASDIYFVEGRAYIL